MAHAKSNSTKNLGHLIGPFRGLFLSERQQVVNSKLGITIFLKEEKKYYEALLTHWQSFISTPKCNNFLNVSLSVNTDVGVGGKGYPPPTCLDDNTVS